MTIRKKTILAVGLTFVILLVILLVYMRFVVFRGFLELESRNVLLNMERTANALGEMLINMNSTAKDWASWNETYEFLGGSDPEYIENNLMDDTLLTLNINFMLFFNTHHRLVVGKHVDLIERTSLAPPADLVKAVLSVLAEAKPGDPFNEKKGVLMIGATPALVVVRPVLKSDGSGPHRGFLVLGRCLDQTQKTRLSNVLRLALETLSVEKAGALFSTEDAASIKQGQILQKAANENTMAGYTVIKDFFGAPAFVLKIEMPRHIYNQGKKAWVFGIVSLIATCLVFSLMVIWFLENVVLTPLNRLSRRVAGIDPTDDPLVRVPVERKDELGMLAEKINQMLGQIQEKTLQLQQANADLKKDIDARIRDQKALKESEHRYRSILEAVPNAIAIIGVRDDHFKEINEGFTRTLGHCRESVVGKTFFELNGYVDGGDRDRFAQQFQKDDQINGMRMQLRAENGRIMDVILSARHMIYNGEDCTVMSIVDDTSRKLAEKEKNELKAQLQQSQKMESIGTLAGGIAHDFNNILSSILGYGELALDCSETETPLHQYLQAVLTAGDRAKNLVRQILTFARQTDVEEKPVRVKLLAVESLKLIRASIPATIAIRKNIQSDSLISANPTQIHQVIMNLCTNAAQAMEEAGGALTVELKDVVLDGLFTGPYPEISPGKYLLLRIADTGPGIRPDILEKIFDPYFTTKEIGKGTGLGLSVVKGIVDALRGLITIQSEMGKGTVFDVYFPILEIETDEKAIRTEKEEAPTGNERILFIDDEPPIAEVHENMLKSLGYQVTTKTSPTEALALFTADPDGFDLIISDITMPNMTGDMLAAQVLKIRPDIPVILCSGYNKRISVERAKEIGVKAFLFKPVGKIQMAETIREVLKNDE